jgi:hypothetical protein
MYALYKVLRVLLLIVTVTAVASSVAAAVNGMITPHPIAKEAYHQMADPICNSMIEAVGSRIHDTWMARTPVSCSTGMLQLSRGRAP